MRAGIVGSIVALIVVTEAVVSRLGWIGRVIGPLLFLTLIAAKLDSSGYGSSIPGSHGSGY